MTPEEKRRRLRDLPKCIPVKTSHRRKVLGRAMWDGHKTGDPRLKLRFVGCQEYVDAREGKADAEHE